MASPSSMPWLGQRPEWISDTPIHLIAYGVTAAVILSTLVIIGSSSPKNKNLPLVNAPTSFLGIEAKKRFVFEGNNVIAEGRALYPQKPHRITTDNGEVVMLPSSFANEIRNNPSLNFNKNIEADLHGGIPGFEVITAAGKSQGLVTRMAKNQLTKTLSKVTEPLSQETAFALSIHWGESFDWHEISLKETILDIVARMSSRVFLGDEICRNEEWLRITKLYTVQLFYAGFRLRLWPRPLRRWVHWFVPSCRELRSFSTEARKIITPVIAKRQKLREDALEAEEGNGSMPEINDALEWAETDARGVEYDPATVQLSLSLAAIHTTTDLMGQCLIEIAQHPDILRPLREEIVTVLRTDGWKKTALYNMKLLDSVIKETQRRKPISMASMRRYVDEDVRLSDGTLIEKGSRTAVDSFRMWDPDFHDKPDEWDGWRFYRMREQPDRKHMALVASTSEDHIAFGHGMHACPGRFFAANEIKVGLCHMLIKYDVELVEGTKVEPQRLGFSMGTCPATRVRVRRRKDMELDIDSI